VRAVRRARNARGLDTMIAVAGCVAQAEGQQILERASVVDLVVGPQSHHGLPSLIGRVRDGERVVATDFFNGWRCWLRFFRAVTDRPRRKSIF